MYHDRTQTLNKKRAAYGLLSVSLFLLTLAAGRLGAFLHRISGRRMSWALSLHLLLRRQEGGDRASLFLHGSEGLDGSGMVRYWGGGSGFRPNKSAQLYFHTGVFLHGGVSELVSSCVCRSLRSVVLGFMDGVGQAKTRGPPTTNSRGIGGPFA